MAEEVRQVEHYSASIPNKVGKGARVLRALRDAGVNLIAFWVREQRSSSPCSGLALASLGPLVYLLPRTDKYARPHDLR